ncbi:MAG: hypothetical protein ACLRSD_04760 [Oscillibacter sp.]
MKNWKKTGIAALCVAALLAGCGTQGGDTNNNDSNTDEPKEITLEQVRVDNIPEKLLENHEAVTVSIQGTDQDSKETYTAKVQYTRDDKGNLLLASHYSYTADSPMGEDEFLRSGLPVDRGKRRVSQQNGKRRAPEYELLPERRV